MELGVQNDSHMGSPRSTMFPTVRLRCSGLLRHADSYVVTDVVSYQCLFCNLTNVSSELAASKLTSTR